MEREDKIANLSLKIMQNCRTELTALFPMLNGAFSELKIVFRHKSGIFGTDGKSIYIDPAVLIERFKNDPKIVKRGYIHMVLHCMYLHIFREKREPAAVWNLSCDMAAEKIIESLGCDALDIVKTDIKEKCLEILGGKAKSPDEIFGMINSGAFPFSIDEMQDAFYFDDHIVWATSKNKDTWLHILAFTKRHDGGKRRGITAGNDTETAKIKDERKYDYRSFLRQFTHLREEVTLDNESFDYVYYNFGMEHYGNLPFIEPLEYREVNRLSELVIAIDTSGSCDKETVERFLSETFSIFKEKENFFTKMKVYIIQCDLMIQDVTVIHSEEELKEYGKSIVIKGRGGTDFTPVFRYADDLSEKKELKDLKAVLYFTDGDGAFPRVKPNYEAAFVLLKDSGKPDLVPPWAITLMID